MSLGNFGGTLYLGNTMLCSFKFINGVFVPEELVIFDDDCSFCPMPLKGYADAEGWEVFLESRLVPEWRHEYLDSLLENTPMTEYDEEQLLRYTRARVMTDHYWVQEDFDMRCWSAVQIDLLQQANKLFYIGEERL